MKFPSLRRNNIDGPTLPKEVQAYYEAEKRDRRGVAGLLAVGTLVVTILLAAGLFFGGRWAYQKIRGDDNKQPTVATTSTSSTNTESTSNNSDSNSSNGTSDSTAAVVNNALGNSGSNTSGSGSSPTSTTPASGATSPTASGATGNLPSAGSDGSVAAFIGATLGSIVIAELYQRRKLTR